MAISYLGSVKANGLADITTAQVDTTGADFAVMVISCQNTYNGTPSDNNDSTWIQAPSSYTNNQPRIRVWYAALSGNGPFHTFTAPGSVVGTVTVAFFSGVEQVAPVITQNGANTYGTSLATGLVTPTENDCLVISGASMNGVGATPMSINSGFTKVQESDFVSGTSYGGALAYSIQTTATAVNPTWTRSNTNGMAVTSIVFAPAGGSASTSPSSSPSAASPIKAFGYYPKYRVGLPSVANLPFNKLSHIGFFNLAPTSTGGITYPEGSLIPDLPSLVSNAHANGTKVVLVIGGAGAAPDTTWRAAITTYKTTFINNLVSLRNTYGFDGYDLDWEPFSSQSDQGSFETFVSDLKSALGASSTLTAFLGNTAWKRTMAANIQNNIDFFNLSTYDLSYGYSTTMHDSPLYATGGQPTGESASDYVQLYIAAGIARSKINIGTPWYTAPWTGSSGLYTSGTFDPDSAENYSELAGVSGTSAPTGEVYDSNAKAAYIYSGGIFKSYNNAAAIQAKVDYVESEGLAGIAIWDIGQAYFPGSSTPWPLLEPVPDQSGGISSVSSSPSTSPSTSPSLSPSTSPSTSVSSSISSSPSTSPSTSPSPSVSSSESASPSPSESSSPSASSSPSSSVSSSPSSSPSANTSESSSPSPSESASPSTSESASESASESTSPSTSPSTSESASESSSPSPSESSSPSTSASSSISSSPSTSPSSSPSPSASSSPSSSPSDSVSPSASPSPQVWGEVGINLKVWIADNYH